MTRLISARLDINLIFAHFRCRPTENSRFGRTDGHTDEAIIEGVEAPKSLAPPPLQPTGVIGFGHMGYRFNPWFDRSGATEAIFKF